MLDKDGYVVTKSSSPMNETFVKDIKWSETDEEGYINISLKIKVDKFSETYNPYKSDKEGEIEYRHSVELIPLTKDSIAGYLCLKDYFEYNEDGSETKTAGDKILLRTFTAEWEKSKEQ